MSELASALAGAGRWWVTCMQGAIEVRAAFGTHPPIADQRRTGLAPGPQVLVSRLAVAISGHRPITTLLPDPQRPGVPASVRSGAVQRPAQAEQALFVALIRPPATQPAGPAVHAAAAATRGRH